MILNYRDIKMLKDSGEINVVGAELAVSVMLSSLVRRGICPNFVVTRGAFSCPFKPPAKVWGSENNKCPKGDIYTSPKLKKFPKEPKTRGRYQYIRMELCDCGDAEEYIKTLPDELIRPEEARQLLFQMAFSLHAAAIRFSLKHYDVKLLNYFCQRMNSKHGGDTVLRYGLGDHVFAMRTPSGLGIMAKLADYGTANVDSATNGQQVTIAQFTTLENTPADFMILGDKACQGHGHDNWGLGLCMLHLYTGHAPYEEIMEEVTCPSNLRKRLCKIWECEFEEEFSVIRGVILADVHKDEEGHILEGEPNEVLYDTFYRCLVLFGLPELTTKLRNSKVWLAVRECLQGPQNAKGKTSKGKKTNDISQYTRDCRKYSIEHGNNKYIARARKSLQSMDGGMELLKSLVSFDPQQRFTALDAMNSSFMEPLRESAGGFNQYKTEDDVRTYTSFSTKYE
jgi:serine/threonine protein kinase